MAFVSAILLLLTFSSPLVSASQAPTAYEVLQEYNLPVGLLPNGVTGYNLDNSTGIFSAYLNGTCEFHCGFYEFKYRSTITGIIAQKKLSELTGIKVKVFGSWLKISEVSLDDDDLEFSVGSISPEFPVRNFYESPTCGCGFDCLNHVNLRKMKIDAPLSSSS